MPSLLQSLTRPVRKARAPERHRRGQWGERLAERHLRQAGLRVITRNWRHGRDEIDLICREGQVLVFVEVRTRAADALVSGYHSVTRSKKTALRRACRAYLNQLRSQPANVRFDIVEVSLCQDNNFSLHHYTNIPLIGNT